MAVMPLERRDMKHVTYSLVLTFLLISAAVAEETPADIRATTANGDAVILHADGQWEYVDTKKAQQAQEVARKLNNRVDCPVNSQGTLLGFGRCIRKGDKEYNRGSLSGKGW
jgi:hypothetical protein